MSAKQSNAKRFGLKKVAGLTLSSLAVAGMLAVSAAPASAAPRHHGWNSQGNHQMHRSHRNHRSHRAYRGHRRDNWQAPAAGLLGLGAGLIIGSAIASPPPPPPPPAYRGSPRAWSPDWMAYCTSKYRSFNPRTGYYLGYDGDYHFCR